MVDFVFIRCSNGLTLDSRVDANVSGARAAGVSFGLYHYYAPGIDPIHQADFAASLVQKYKPELSIAIDLEEPSGLPSDLTERVRIHMERLAAQIPRTPLIYTSAGYWIGTLKAPDWGKRYPLWLAAWTTASKPIVPKPWNNWTFWQYSNSGKGSDYGVQSSMVDLNRFNGSRSEFEAWRTKPESDAIDLLPYLHGDGRMYEVQHVGAGTETFQSQSDDTWWYLVKNSQWEQLYHDAQWIWRGLDTSPGNGRFYQQYEPGLKRARWMPRFMAVGDSWEGPGHEVRFYNKADCSPSVLNSGNATNRMTFRAYYTALTWNGVTVKDVVELTNGHEVWFYAKGWGLVAWESQDGGKMAICAVYAPGERPALVREKLPCQM